MRSLLYFLLFVVFLHSPPAIAEGVDKSWRSTPQGDYGYFATDGDPQGHVMYLVPGDQNALVSRWRSEYGNKYRLWTDTERLVVGLKTRADFDSALRNFGNREDQGRHWCEVVENTWSAWASGPIPSECGVHTVNKTRTCTSGAAFKPCSAGTCPNASESETYVVDNGTCNTNTAPSIYLTGTDISGPSRSVFSPGFSFYDAEGDALEALWTGTTACVGVYQTGIWLSVSNSIGARFSRTIQPGYMGNRCQINVRVRDQNGLEGTPKWFSGWVTNSCSPQVFTAPDGSTPAEYALTCSPPAEFTITDQCGELKNFPCEGEVVAPVWSDWMQNGGYYYYQIGRIGLNGRGGIKHEIRWAASTIASWTEPDGSPTTPIDKVVNGFTYQGGAIFRGPYTYDWQKRAIRRIETN